MVRHVRNELFNKLCTNYWAGHELFGVTHPKACRVIALSHLFPWPDSLAWTLGYGRVVLACFLQPTGPIAEFSYLQLWRRRFPLHQQHPSCIRPSHTLRHAVSPYYVCGVCVLVSLLNTGENPNRLERTSCRRTGGHGYLSASLSSPCGCCTLWIVVVVDRREE